MNAVQKQFHIIHSLFSSTHVGRTTEKKKNALETWDDEPGTKNAVHLEWFSNNCLTSDLIGNKWTENRSFSSSAKNSIPSSQLFTAVSPFIASYDTHFHAILALSLFKIYSSSSFFFFCSPKNGKTVAPAECLSIFHFPFWFWFRPPVSFSMRKLNSQLFRFSLSSGIFICVSCTVEGNLGDDVDGRRRRTIAGEMKAHHSYPLTYVAQIVR